MDRPIIKVDNTLIFPDGTSRKMKLSERIKWKRGKLEKIKLSSGKPTKLL